MPKQSYINTRMETGTKRAAESVFRRLGLSPSEAIRLFYRQVILRRGIPFEVKVPNRETRAAMRELRERRAALPRYASTRQLMADTLGKPGARNR